MPDRDALTRGSQRNGAKTAEPVSWEMIVRFNGDHIRVELRALAEDRAQLTVRIWNDRTDHLAVDVTRSHDLTFSELRQALDELERSAKEVEQLGT